MLSFRTLGISPLWVSGSGFLATATIVAVRVAFRKNLNA